MENQAINFFEVHGFWFVFFMFFFPRLTLFFATICGGVWWWLGLIFVPRITVAILATIAFANTNPALVAFTWLWAFVFEIADMVKISAASKSR
jgi:hypothetical protein